MMVGTTPAFRAVRAVAFVLIMLAAIVLPEQLFSVSVAHRWTWALLSVWLGFGGFVCALGHSTGRYLGEYVGLPFVSSALVGFGVLQLSLAGYEAVPSVALLWAFALLMFARWRDVVVVFRIARRQQRSGRGDT
jgi:hypothetical protein